MILRLGKVRQKGVSEEAETRSDSGENCGFFFYLLKNFFFLKFVLLSCWLKKDFFENNKKLIVVKHLKKSLGKSAPKVWRGWNAQ